MSDLIVRGRYQIVPEGESKVKPHTRVSNFAKKLEDGYTLTAWGKRMVLFGAAQRPDIIAATLAAGVENKAELNRLAESAMDAAKANVARETGTALHSLCEQVDQGVDVQMPSPWREDVAAYRACLEDMGATVERCEEVVVIPDLGLAGRFDRIVKVADQSFIMDIKTGRDLSYSWLSIAIQLALYAEASTIYDHEKRSHTPMPPVSRQFGLVVHLPAGEAKGTPYWVDLNAGRKGVDLTKAVLRWRSTRDVADVMPTASSLAAPLREYVASRVAAIVECGHGDELAKRWPHGVPTLKASFDHTEAQYNSILGACTTVEGLMQMPFPELSDPRNRDPMKATRKGKK
jgi:hypothetical protein